MFEELEDILYEYLEDESDGEETSEETSEETEEESGESGESTESEESSESTEVNVSNEINIDFGKTTDHQGDFTVDGLERILKFSLGSDPFLEFLKTHYPDDDESQIQSKYNDGSLKEKFYKNWFNYIHEIHNLDDSHWLDPYSGLNVYDDAPFTIHDVIELRDPNSGLPILKDGKKIYVERPTQGQFDGNIRVASKVKNEVLPYTKKRFIQECAMRIYSNYSFYTFTSEYSKKYNLPTIETIAKSVVQNATLLANELEKQNLLNNDEL